ncbi:MAG TPA: TolC family protein [Flavobacteriaceae bacterium]|nr:TolC family protein [Flavobacteriaceae bacterium]
MKARILSILFLLTLPVWSQEQITLEECYSLVAKNYPLAKQPQLLEQQSNLDIEAASNEKLPKLDLSAQATYQSDVIEVPIQNSGIEPLNKDQYRATLSINQLIYNGGRIDASSNLKSAQLKTKKQEVEVSLYQLKKQVNQLYFSILLAQEKHKLLMVKQTQLQAKLKEVQSGIANGTVLPSSDKVLQAELLKIKQQFAEVDHNKASLVANLSALIAQPLQESTTFQDPMVKLQIQSELKRPELELFQLKKAEIESSESLMAKQRAPKLMGFATGGYGNPGLNMLDNSFQPFYTVGLKLDWNIFDWNTNKKKRESLAINKYIVDTNAEVFKLNTNMELQRQRADIQTIEDFIATDSEIVELQRAVLKSADSQFKNGIITASAYLTELTNLYQEQNRLTMHSIQLQLAKANYNIIQGQ